MSTNEIVNNVYQKAVEGKGCDVQGLVSNLSFDERRSILNQVVQRSQTDHANGANPDLPRVSISDFGTNPNKMSTNLNVESAVKADVLPGLSLEGTMDKTIYSQRKWFGKVTESCQDVPTKK